MTGFINKHPVATYFALTLAISWGGILLVAGPDGIPATNEEFERLFPFVFLSLLAGPSLAALLLASLTDGRAGRRELLTRLLTARLDAHWYAVGARGSVRPENRSRSRQRTSLRRQPGSLGRDRRSMPPRPTARGVVGQHNARK